MNNVLVTGASGLIGGILNAKLTEHNLFGIDIKECNYKNFEILDERVQQQFIS